MGLGGMKYGWQRQTKDFAHTKGDKYSSLILDNRGVGESDKPLKRYSTSEMAKDVIEVLDHIGWTRKREIHLIGISMGGMIAQEIVSGLFPLYRSSRNLPRCVGVTYMHRIDNYPCKHAAFLRHSAKITLSLTHPLQFHGSVSSYYICTFLVTWFTFHSIAA